MRRFVDVRPLPGNGDFGTRRRHLTLRLDLDLGFGIHEEELSCRVFGVNAPELATPAGKVALAFVQSVLKVGDSVKVTSHGWDKFGGRFDGQVTLPGGRDLAQLLLDSGNAVPM